MSKIDEQSSGKKEGEMCFFADLAVYTKNRAFRLVYSSKYYK